MDLSFETFNHEGKQKGMDGKSGKSCLLSFFILVSKMGNIRECVCVDMNGALESC